jgi:hypothetical protein
MNPDKYQAMRSLFKSYNDKLSYQAFFTFLENDLEIKMDDWEEDAL